MDAAVDQKYDLLCMCVPAAGMHEFTRTFSTAPNEYEPFLPIFFPQS